MRMWYARRTMRIQGSAIRSFGMHACVCLWLGCHPQPTPPTSTTPAEDFTLAQAEAVVEQEHAESGWPSQSPTPVASVAEVLVILRHDETVRFAASRDYLAKLEGVDALILRATLETVWAEGFLTVAAIERERATRVQARIDALKGQPASPERDKDLKQAESEIEHERLLNRAINVLATPHYDAGMNFAREVERRNPERPESYVILANLFRIREDWVEFDRNIRKAESNSPDRLGIAYARAMERAVRQGDRPGARQALTALLGEHPDFTRARAQLVLLEDDIEPRYNRLQELRAANAQHTLIAIEGRAIVSEYETARALREAQGATAAAPQP